MELMMLILVISTSFVGTIGLFYILYHHLKLEKGPKAIFFRDLTIGHRGEKSPEFFHEENTVSASLSALKKGANGIEFDIQVTKDNYSVVFHDNNLKRVCNSHEEDYNKNIKNLRDLTLKEIQTNFKFKKGLNEEQVETLDSFLSKILSKYPKTKFMIEIKEYTKNDIIVEHVINSFKKFNLYNTSVVGSFNPYVLYLLRKKDPKIVTNLLVVDDLFSNWLLTKGGDPKGGNDSPIDKNSIFPLSLISKKIFHKKFFLSILDFAIYKSCLTYLPSLIGSSVLGFDYDLIKKEIIDIQDFLDSGYDVNLWVVNNKKEKTDLEKKYNKILSITTDKIFH